MVAETHRSKAPAASTSIAGALRRGLKRIKAVLAPVGMVFVRCEGGVSHNPAESITAADAEAGARVLLRVLNDFGENS